MEVITGKIIKMQNNNYTNKLKKQQMKAIFRCIQLNLKKINATHYVCKNAMYQCYNWESELRING